MTILMHTDADIIILVCQGFSEKNILSLQYDHLRQIFDDLYQDRILGRENLGYSTMDKTTKIMWAMLQNHEAMEEFTKYNIKFYPSITSIFVYFLITANISEPLQDILEMKRDIKALSTKSDRHSNRLNKLEE